MTVAVRLGEDALNGPPELWRTMTKRLMMTMSTIALAVTGALVPNAAFAGDDSDTVSESAVSSGDRGTSWECARTDRGGAGGLVRTDRGTSWESHDTLTRGTSWE
jgi:hypothetical protein